MQVYGAGDSLHADAESTRVFGVVGWAVAAGSVILGWTIEWAMEKGSLSGIICRRVSFLS